MELPTAQLIVDTEVFLRYEPTGGRSRQSRLPFGLLLWDCACQRRKTLADYDWSVRRVPGAEGVERYRVRIPQAYLRFEFEIAALPKGFAFRVFPDTLIEERPDGWRLLELDVLPEFWETAQGDDGYFLMPMYCGGLMRFDRTAPLEERAMVYGEQPRWEDMCTMPICGVKHGDAWLCILAGGQFDARIVARTLDRDGAWVNRLCPAFIFRHEHADNLVDDVKEARFIHFPEETAGWNDMARVYRDYVIADRGIRPLRERFADNPVLARAARSYHCKIFHGIKSGRTSDGYEEMTVQATFQETAGIARAMKDAGVGDCVLYLTGWNPEGHDGMWPTRFPLEPRLGGHEGWKAMARDLRANGFQLSVHDNHVDAYQRSEYFEDVAKLTDSRGQWVGGSQWGGGVMWRICPKTAPNAHGLLDLERIHDLGVNGIYYVDAMPSPLFMCYDPKHPCSRRQYAEGLRRICAACRDRFGAVGAEVYFDYLAEACDMAWHCHTPLPAFVRFELPAVVDELVPFWQAVFHGLQLYHLCYCYRYADHGFSTDQAIALELALGALPMNEVCQARDDGFYVPNYHATLGAMGRQYQIVCKEYADLQSALIDQLDFDAENRTIETRYDDGRTVRADLNAGTWEVA